MSRSTQRLTSSGSGFKCLRIQGDGLKSHPTDWEKPGFEPATPGLQDISIPYTMEAQQIFNAQSKHVQNFIKFSLKIEKKSQFSHISRALTLFSIHEKWHAIIQVWILLMYAITQNFIKINPFVQKLLSKMQL